MKTKILQFGEGNFLRGFVDFFVQLMNEKNSFDAAVQIIQPRRESLSPVSQALNAQGGCYQICTRGILSGETIEQFKEITCVKGVDVWSNIEKYALEEDLRFVFSNTTESGIEYVKGAETFPAKVSRFLSMRQKANLPGLVFIPCELIENNGEKLKECILKYIDDAGEASLRSYVEKECVFCSTLVDRIVSGYPDDESAARYEKMLGKKDECIVCAEPFHFIAIQTPNGYDLESEMPLKASGVNVVYAPDIAPYRKRKVRFLNATHTTMVYPALERGFTEVAEALEDPSFNSFIRKVLFEEIFPTVDLPDDEKTEYVNSVLERFANPFAHHRLESIALNTVSKWKARCLPVVCDYAKIFGRLPENIMQGYDAMARHYDNKH
jgi:tagaturonate reductase